ncbi:MAG TPA: 50S ribosomal protein L21e [Candidatus Thermoplasmatota archaeon]|nr:50S ribosomal protein L21e [Candidatus Thermoplasmatota archaeon]
MVVRSKGFRSKSRYKLLKEHREKGMPPVTHALREFAEGDKVGIKINASIHKGMPHPRFQGLTGTVAGRQGTSFVVHVQVGGKMKTLVTRPEHLKLNTKA